MLEPWNQEGIVDSWKPRNLFLTNIKQTEFAQFALKTEIKLTVYQLSIMICNMSQLLYH